MNQEKWVMCFLCGYNGESPHTCEKGDMVRMNILLRKERNDYKAALEGFIECEREHGGVGESCGCAFQKHHAVLEKWSSKS